MTALRQNRITLIQPVVPSYRRGFFSALSKSLGGRFSVYASVEEMGVLTKDFHRDGWERALGKLKWLLPGLEWQVGAMSVPISRGDILVVSGAPRCLSNLALLLCARFRGARTVWWGQYWSASTRWHRFVLRLLLMRLAHAVLFYTDAEVAAYRAGWGRCDKRPLHALNNGIDIEPVRRLRRSYLPEERGANLLFIGRITKKSNLGLLLRAMTNPLLAEVTLHIVGDGPERILLQHEIEKAEISGRVLWHGATVDEARIAAIANQTALFCYPGAVGLSLIHAMAYGLPAVVHDDRLTHMPEIAAFEDGRTGASFRKDDPFDLACVIARLLDAPDQAQALSHNGLRLADHVYNTTVMTERFLSLIEAL